MRPSMRRGLLASVIAVAIGLIGIVGLLIWNWPFTQSAVTKALEDRFSHHARIRQFQRTYFPPGFVARGVELTHRQRKDIPPLITVETLRLRTSYTKLLRIQQQVDDVQIAGLHLVVPPKSAEGSDNTFPLTNSVSGKNLTIGEIRTDDAVLDFIPKEPGGERFTLQIDHLALDHVGGNDPLSFHARLKNTEPPGNIQSDGQFGPWNENDPGSTPVSGVYTYEHAKLDVFEGIRGTLSSHGRFGGVLRHIHAEGNVQVPDFKAAKDPDAVSLPSYYDAVIDGTNGDTALTRVESHFGRTALISYGTVKGHPSGHGKTVNLVMSVNHGRIEDVLHLLAGSARPAENGDFGLRMKVELPPGPAGVLTRLRLVGEFGIGGAHFTDPKIQMPVNRLAEGALHETKEEEKADPATVLSNLKGHVTASGGIARLSRVSFTEPGTLAEVEGTYNLINKNVNLRGVLHTHGKLADTTSGFKSILLKAVGPFIKNKSVTVVPFVITGTSSDPSFALDLIGKRHLRRDAALPGN